ncbi:MAG: (Fe-S)-binding protein [Firmicutes bacterium HGW-Firmicutes-15]|nr:MAG: (Fe-S)-binding protein [Firmicutes bacterium HGW-Firmicutes-15]
MNNNDWLIHLIREYVENYPQLKKTHTCWKDPLVGVVNANDPRFAELKEQVGPFHLIPQDLLPAAKTVICYFLPFISVISRSNKAGNHCSDEWAYAYLETNQLIEDLNCYVQEQMNQRGHVAVVTPATHNFDQKTLLSNWSHRHIAVIAGLGTIGLNNMLITDYGCSGRLGSFVSDMELTATPSCDMNACLYYFNKSCLQCIKNCPAGALLESAFDRHKCYELLLQNSEFHRNKGYVDACGKCVSHIPCAFTNPVKRVLLRAVNT